MSDKIRRHTTLADWMPPNPTPEQRADGERNYQAWASAHPDESRESEWIAEAMAHVDEIILLMSFSESAKKSFILECLRNVKAERAALLAHLEKMV